MPPPPPIPALLCLLVLTDQDQDHASQPLNELWGFVHAREAEIVSTSALYEGI